MGTEPLTRAQATDHGPEPQRNMSFSITNCYSAKSGANDSFSHPC